MLNCLLKQSSKLVVGRIHRSTTTTLFVFNRNLSKNNFHLFLNCRQILTNSRPTTLFQSSINNNQKFAIHTSSKIMNKNKATLIGVYENSNNKDTFVFTPSGKKINSSVNGLIEKQLNIEKGKVRILYDLSPEFPVVGIVGLGPETATFNELEELDEKLENIRSAIANGVRSLRDLGSIDEINVDGCLNPKAASEGANLGLYYFDELKSAALKKSKVELHLLADGISDENEWNAGVLLSNGQNLCRTLMENPANLMTPTKFAQIAVETFSKLNVTVHVRDKAWAESMKMGSFLSVAKGSDEPPVFLEVHYNNAPNTKPLVFVGKGITFDSGGISLKASSNMDRMRADMGGAANVLSTIYTLASKKSPVNIIGLMPLCENMPNGRANKPGDVVTAMNGKTIQINNTDAEGRLILADGLCYAHKFDPFLLMDIATLTGAIGVALGSSATGVFSTSNKYWTMLQKCGVETGDRMWRMPLFNHFTKQTTDSQLADLCNIGKYVGQGGSCIAAAFLREFVTCNSWIHFDIAGVMDNKDEVAYLSKGMSGRPLRTLVRFVEEIFENKAF
ncbi:bleomycin hydrolase [Dermatophagoides pteronyssinus]|uniref:Cytosol aminopeptidase n=1 Tax=Dermatophagoides pteronyssinus TaxID=6956 RepID=A0ABQ8IXG4_DERPT|nr:bleomycin hydrolase [Dermatophagoides pteronyssinus]